MMSISPFCSVVNEFSRSLFRESSHSFFAIRLYLSVSKKNIKKTLVMKLIRSYRCESGMKDPPLKMKSFLKCHLISHVDTFFTHGNNQLRVRGNFLSCFHGLRYELLDRDHPTDQAYRKAKPLTGNITRIF